MLQCHSCKSELSETDPALVERTSNGVIKRVTCRHCLCKQHEGQGEEAYEEEDEEEEEK